MLVDYRDHFYISVRHKDASMDVESIRRYFREEGWSLAVKKFPDVDFRSESYAGKWILYQSSEDRDLFYKSYIEDVLLGLSLQGARLIPDFRYFRAHHNKVFMEILRDLSRIEDIRNIRSRGYGTYEDFANAAPEFPSGMVSKPSEGCGSSGVKLLKDDASKNKHIRQMSRSLHPMDAIKNIVKSQVWPAYDIKSNHRKKFIVQSYVPDLKNDYKVLAYGEKFYVLLRHNRKNDFRASGSGLFSFHEDVPGGLLDFAARVFDSMDTPYLSMDIGYNGREFFLFEFQAAHFGNYTLEKSAFYFVREAGQWRIVHGKSALEEEFARSVARYIESKECK